MWKLKGSPSCPIIVKTHSTPCTTKDSKTRNILLRGAVTGVVIE